MCRNRRLQGNNKLQPTKYWAILSYETAKLDRVGCLGVRRTVGVDGDTKMKAQDVVVSLTELAGLHYSG